LHRGGIAVQSLRLSILVIFVSPIGIVLIVVVLSIVVIVISQFTIVVRVGVMVTEIDPGSRGKGCESIICIKGIDKGFFATLGSLLTILFSVQRECYVTSLFVGES